MQLVSTSVNFAFMMDWVAGAQFAGLHWAQANGFYESVGLHVTLQPWQADGRSLLTKLANRGATGELCAGCAEDNLIVKQAVVDKSVLAFGAMLKDTPMVLMSPAAKPIHQFSDLRGKRVGMHEDGIRALEIVLALEGMRVDEVDIHEVGFDLDHLRSQRFDALQGYLMSEPVQLANLGFAVETLAMKHPQLLPYAQVYVAGRSFLEHESEAFAAFLAASSAGWSAVCEQPDEAAHLLARVWGDPLQATEQRQMLERIIPLVAGESGEAIGTLNAEQWERNLATYFEFGLIDRPIEFHEVARDLSPTTFL
jgi:NitT/TauT family transport system substrate-binding protein